MTKVPDTKLGLVLNEALAARLWLLTLDPMQAARWAALPREVKQIWRGQAAEIIAHLQTAFDLANVKSARNQEVALESLLAELTTVERIDLAVDYASPAKPVQ